MFLTRSALVLLLVLAIAGCGSSPNRAEPQNLLPGLQGSFQGTYSWEKVAQTERMIAYDWGKLSPFEGLLPGSFSAQWEGYLVAPESGAYQLELSGEGQGRLSLDGHTVILGQSTTLNLSAQQAYALKLSYQKTGVRGSLVLRWKRPTEAGEGQVVPASVFKHAAETGLQGVGTQAVTPGVNLIRNPGFEDDTSLWVRYSGNRSLVAGHTSTYALEVGNLAWTQQDLPISAVEGGVSYTFSGWGKRSEGSAACRAVLAYGESGRLTLSFEGSSWTQQTAQVTLPLGTGYMGVYLTGGPNSTTTCQFDDLALVAASSTTPPPAPPAATSDSPILNNTFAYGTQGWQVFGSATTTTETGPKAAVLAPNTWMQQNLSLSNLLPGRGYQLIAPLELPEAGGTCSLGLVAGLDDGSSRLLALTRASSTGLDSSVSYFTLPSNLSWVAVYAASASKTCLVNGLTLRVNGDLPGWQDTGAALPGESNFMFVTLDNQGNLAGSSDNGGRDNVWVYENGNLTLYPTYVGSNPIDQAQPLQMVFDNNNRPVLYYEVSNGPNLTDYVVRWNGSAWEAVGRAMPFDDARRLIANIAVDSDNSVLGLFVRSDDYTLERFSGGAWRVVRSFSFPSESWATLQKARNGDLVVQTTGSSTVIERYRAGSWSRETYGAYNSSVLGPSGEVAGLRDSGVYTGDTYLAPTSGERTRLVGYAGNLLVAEPQRPNNLAVGTFNAALVLTGQTWAKAPNVPSRIHLNQTSESAAAQIVLLPKADGTLYAWVQYQTLCTSLYCSPTETRLYTIAP